jgi:hypothetical protein
MDVTYLSSGIYVQNTFLAAYIILNGTAQERMAFCFYIKAVVIG